MKVIKIILVAAMTMALTITLSMKILYQQEKKLPFAKPEKKPPTPSHRLSRFLVESDRNPRAADHCHKDNETCSSDEFGANATCCNNKCVELATDRMNCGACKNKCKYTYSCCRGECVDLAFDKRHCGKCNNRCMPNGFCIYGMCDYA